MPQITVTKIIDGPRNAVFHVAIEGDGSGDLTDYVVIDPETDLSPPLKGKPTFTVGGLQYDLSGFDAKLEFDYLASDTLVWAMTGDNYSDVDLCFFGGLKDRSGIDGQGKLKLSTRGLGAAETGVIIIKLRKD